MLIFQHEGGANEMAERADTIPELGARSATKGDRKSHLTKNMIFQGRAERAG